MVIPSDTKVVTVIILLQKTNILLGQGLIIEVNIKYIENKTVDFEEYFEDVVGVSISENLEPVKIVLQISKDLWPYIESKPIHGSQRIISKDNAAIVIELSLQINYEVTSLIFAFGDDVKVVAPAELIVSIKNKAEALYKNYL